MSKQVLESDTSVGTVEEGEREADPDSLGRWLASRQSSHRSASLRAGERWAKRIVCERPLVASILESGLEAYVRRRRELRARCLEMLQRLARTVGKSRRTNVPAGVPLRARDYNLVIRDLWHSGKCWIEVDGTAVGLSPKPFVMVAKLALARKQDVNQGYVYKVALDPAACASWTGMRRLYLQLERAGIRRGSLIEKDERGSFRVSFQLDQITIDPAALARHLHEEVRRAFSDFKKP
jgi:hypothetical protein